MIKKSEHPPMTNWNQTSPSFVCTMCERPECVIVVTLENAYFGTADNKVSAERVVELGKTFEKTVLKYISGD